MLELNQAARYEESCIYLLPVAHNRTHGRHLQLDFGFPFGFPKD